MKLTEIFKKPVDRPIEGVIKADDDKSLQIEIEEYILIGEVKKRLELFLDAYNNYQGANGVWISGFFGSGKSHLLKMLAYLLQSRSEESDHILHHFLGQTTDNRVLQAEIKKVFCLTSTKKLMWVARKPLMPCWVCL